MALEVDEEGLGPPPPNGLDGTIRDTVLVQFHGPTRMEKRGGGGVEVGTPARGNGCSLYTGRG